MYIYHNIICICKLHNLTVTGNVNTHDQSISFKINCFNNYRCRHVTLRKSIHECSGQLATVHQQHSILKTGEIIIATVK